MRQRKISVFAAACIALFFFTIGCNSSGSDKPIEATDTNTQPAATKADPAKLKAEIQELENAWARADNAGDANALAAFYSDDAVSMANNKPMITGNAAIKKDIEESMAKRPKGSTVAYDVLDAYGCENYVTEVGKATRKDSTGKTIYTGKYMAIWEKRNGKWICIRDIGNDDVKEK